MTRAELAKERATIEAQLAKLGPRHDALISEATERVRALERDVEAARRTVGEAVGAKNEAVGPLETRVAGIDAQLRREAPAQVVADLRAWLDLRFAELQHKAPAQSFTYKRPDGPGTLAQQRIYSSSAPSLGAAIARVLEAQREAGDQLLLEVDVEARAEAIRREVVQAIEAIREEKVVEGQSLGDTLVGMASQAVAGLRG